MNDPVAVGSSANEPFLRVVNPEMVEGSGAPGLIVQFAVQPPQLVFQMCVKGEHGGLEALAPRRLPGGTQ